MIHRMLLTVLTGLIFIAFAASQPVPDTADVRAEVKELGDFHEVIFKIWHTAWPKQDVALLAQLLPEVRSGAAAVAGAKLPGILREKKAAWDANVSGLQAIVGEYAAASSPVDSAKLMDAAERLHAQYEKLVRTVRPVLPELDEFHTALYPLYHYYLPQNDSAKVAGAVKLLSDKMTGLNAAALPKRLAPKEKAFAAARKKLSVSVGKANRLVAEGKPMRDIAAAVKTLHANYQALEKVFE